eukprot:CAMPEP_0177631466 /NCGR_PEP_ID=MMETSP0447-20121125/1765_1 /TAXON_ID=0 /ORGANISM="Stygamoeba regulata, Strain BSH-02190019" /LENGTH=239 /DNA_ID=CAMNT_0019132953 /DNA_START=346 /DNA_END=1066 /DNA_ORIENTATION=-
MSRANGVTVTSSRSPEVGSAQNVVEAENSSKLTSWQAQESAQLKIRLSSKVVEAAARLAALLYHAAPPLAVQAPLDGELRRFRGDALLWFHTGHLCRRLQLGERVCEVARLRTECLGGHNYIARLADPGLVLLCKARLRARVHPSAGWQGETQHHFCADLVDVLPARPAAARKRHLHLVPRHVQVGAEERVWRHGHAHAAPRALSEARKHGRTGAGVCACSADLLKDAGKRARRRGGGA